MTDYDLYMSDVIYENRKMEEKEMENEIVRIENNEIMVSEDVVQKIIELASVKLENI